MLASARVSSNLDVPKPVSSSDMETRSPSGPPVRPSASVPSTSRISRLGTF